MMRMSGLTLVAVLLLVLASCAAPGGRGYRQLAGGLGRASPETSRLAPASHRLMLGAQPVVESEEEWEEDDEDWGDEEEDTGRSFFYKELVVSGFYSRNGVMGLPMDDPDEDHLEFSPRPPGSYVGFDYIRTFTSASPINQRLPAWFQLTAVDLHPRFLFDRMEVDDGLEHKLDFAPQDFWARFDLGGRDRLTLRVGQFVLPYGVNPPLAPRQKFILPVEALDLGLKWDWGVNLKGPWGEYDWELAATIGSGEALHSTHTFRSSERNSYLFTGRVGTPTYWDLQYGLSFLVGDIPTIRAANVMNELSISRWRVGFDTFYKCGTFLMVGAQVTYGQDGYAGDEEYIGFTGGETADVLAYRLWADWVVPTHSDLRLGAQFESIYRDLSTADSDDTAVVFEVGYSLSTNVSVMMDYRIDINRTMGEEDNAVYVTFVYYGS